MVGVDAHNVVPITRSEAFEAPVWEAMIHVLALVIGAVVSIPVIIAHVRRCVHVALFARFALWPHGLLVSRFRGRRNATVVCARLVMRLALGFPGVRWRLGGTLAAKYGGCQESEDYQNTQRSCLHTLPPSIGCRVLSALCPPIAFDVRLLFFVLIQARMFRGLRNRVRQKLLSMPRRCTRKESQCDQDAQGILVINRTRL
jgi:hypothetical protein